MTNGIAQSEAHREFQASMDLARREREFQADLDPSDTRHDRMFSIDGENINLFWSGTKWPVPLVDIATPLQLLGKLEYFLRLDWEHTTRKRVSAFISAVSLLNGWKRGKSSTGPKSRTTDATTERAKLKPKMRYEVLMRDDFRCRACGFSVESGAHLHIDHIEPISNGGLTEVRNLQALCSTCNHGKGARK